MKTLAELYVESKHLHLGSQERQDFCPHGEPDTADCPECAAELAVDKVDNEDELDRLVQAGSRPALTLPVLFRQGRASGLITSAYNYAHA